MPDLSDWEPVPDTSAIYRAPYKIPFNTTYSTLIKLGQSRYLVYSPGPGLELSFSGIAPDSAEVLLVAPTTGHYLGIRPWLDAFEGARVFASERLHKKLRKKTGVQLIGSPAALASQLPTSIQVHVPPPHFMNELWISIEVDDTVYWLVGDAFLNFDRVDGNAIWKFFLGFYGLKPGLRQHKLFPLGLNREALRRWSRPLFADSRQHVLIPCHRDIYRAPDCGERLAEILG